jgi:hypothetical protein
MPKTIFLIARPDSTGINALIDHGKINFRIEDPYPKYERMLWKAWCTPIPPGERGGWRGREVAKEGEDI